MSNKQSLVLGSFDLGRLATTAAVALPLLLVAALHGGWPRPATAADAPRPDGPWIAVLPLANPTGDARLGRLADALIKDVIADLPRFGVPAIASGTSFGYRDKPHDPRQVGRELGVRYVVEGSLEGDGQRLRAAVDLIDIATGEQVWSERYDRPLEEFFAVQDELTEKIAGSAGGLRDATQRASLEEARGKPTRSLQAYELWLQADRGEASATPRRPTRRRSSWSEQALQLDPQFGRAYLTLAYIYAQRAWNGYAPYAEVAPAWLEAANRAVELLPTSGWARMVLAQRYVMDNDFARYGSGLEQAGDLADGDAALMAELANEMAWAGQTARGVELLDRALRLDPASTGEYGYAQVLGLLPRAPVRGSGGGGRGHGQPGPGPGDERGDDLRPARPHGGAGAVAVPPARAGAGRLGRVLLRPSSASSCPPRPRSARWSSRAWSRRGCRCARRPSSSPGSLTCGGCRNARPSGRRRGPRRRSRAGLSRYTVSGGAAPARPAGAEASAGPGPRRDCQFGDTA